MIPSAFEYARATSLDDALARMQAANGAGKLIAGGHSLVPLMKLRLSEPQLLIDISRIPELAGIRERDGKIVIGACTVHHDVASSALLQRTLPDRCPTRRRPSATRRCAIAARLAAASRMPIPRPTCRRCWWRSMRRSISRDRGAGGW